MGTTLPITCRNCGVTGSVGLDMDVSVLQVGGAINIENPCPICKKVALGAPSGKYVRDENEVLQRVGDYEENS